MVMEAITYLLYRGKQKKASKMIATVVSIARLVKFLNISGIGGSFGTEKKNHHYYISHCKKLKTNACILTDVFFFII